ncbi:MAG TPA: hypothetical protein VGU46_10690 [Acidobacteriaceae bacterium]|nr:hypothetical protein [Acidobacteriaceae bacterium]
MDGFWNKAEHYWNHSHAIAWVLGVLGAVLVTWAALRPQPPGVSVGLLALAAGIMSVRPKIHPSEKAAWMVFLIAFAVLEVRAIEKSDNQNTTDRVATSKSLTEALQGVKRTLEQTQPHALFGNPSIDLPPPTPLEEGKRFSYVLTYQNYGNEVARHPYIFAAMYIGKPNDRKTQEGLALKFEKDWKNGRNPNTLHSEIPPYSPHIGTFQSPAVTRQQVEQIYAAKLTFYIFSRISYTDNTGDWFSDDCLGIFVPLGQSPNARANPCFIHTQYRYRQDQFSH